MDGYYYINEEEQDGRGYKTEQAIQARGSEAIRAQFLYIIDEIKKIFYNKEHTVIQHILNQKVYRGPRYFQSLFLTLYELLIKQEMKIVDYDKVYEPVSYTHLRAHETRHDLVCRLLLEKKKKISYDVFCL